LRIFSQLWPVFEELDSIEPEIWNLRPAMEQAHVKIQAVVFEIPRTFRLDFTRGNGVY
jgi:hypothetical protein